MQAIQTKFLPCTNFRGSRVKASCEAGSITLGWDHALNVDENHAAAAKALCERLGWVGGNHGTLIGGNLPGGGYAFVFKRIANHNSFVNAEMNRINENAQTISIRFSDFDSNATKYLNITKEQFAEIRTILGGI